MQYPFCISFIKGSRAELRPHLAERNVEHAHMVQRKIGAMQSDIDMIQGATTLMQQQQHVLENGVASQLAELRALNADLANLRAELDRNVMAEA
jgi:predicted FMN-binding regulatory protein PaiB